jgi:hypothetical protein
MNAEFEAEGLVVFVQDLMNATAHIVPELRAVVVKGAVNVKADARARFAAQERTGKYLKHYARSITFDVTDTADGGSAEIGPDKDLIQGAFGPGVEFGSSNHAPMPHLFPALDAEEEKAESAVGDAAIRLLS